MAKSKKQSKKNSKKSVEVDESPPDIVAESESDEEEEIASTPFDNPFFLPLLLFGFALWLLYDGFLNQDFIQRNLDEGDTFAIAFNQWGGPILLVLAVWFTFRAIRERRAESDQG